jgi:RsiW-degrading membrane proteinase PrsW (M82 family)
VLLGLNLAVGVTLVLLAAGMRCGEDECLQALVSASLAVSWLLATAAFVWLSRSERLGVRVVAILFLIGWAPVGWATALVLFSLFPSLGGA